MPVVKQKLYMRSFIENLPKAELHLHIEGTFEPELMFEIAQRNQIDIPYNSVEELRGAYAFSCLQDFLDIYYQGASVLIHEKDFYDLTYAYLKRCADENVRHVEIMFDPQTHTHRGIEFETVINGINKACEDATANLGVTSLLIMSYLRHLSEEDAFKTLEQSLPFKHLIKAVGLDSSEMGNPPSKFQRVFEASIEQGYIPVAHAGEEGPAEYIREAIELLKIARIDHGNNCFEDDVIEMIKEKNLALTVCPLSNLSLCVVDDLKNHPARNMLEKGLKVTINSDDPAYFGGGMNANYLALQEALELTREELIELALNSFNYSLLDENMKNEYILEIEQFVEKQNRY